MPVTLQPNEAWRIAGYASWAIAGLYGWLIFAYFVAALRSRSWFWGRRVLGWGQGLIILFVVRLFIGEEFFQPYPNENWREFYLFFGTGFAVLTIVPLFRIVRHFTESIAGDGYWGSRDVILFKAPIGELRGRAAVELWTRYLLIGLMAAIVIGAVVWSIGNLRIGVEIPVFVGIAVIFGLGSWMYRFKPASRTSAVSAAPAAAKGIPYSGGGNSRKRHEQRKR